MSEREQHKEAQERSDDSHRPPVQQETILEQLAMPGAEVVDFDPPLASDKPRAADLE